MDQPVSVQPLKDYPRIIFMGTPDFAVSSLDALVKAGYFIVGVVTAPDKPSGRGLQLSESAVKKYAVQNGLSILQPVKLKDPEFLMRLQQLKADIQIVVAFRMLPEQVWNMPAMGTVNLHGSLLPQYRGAAPINRAIMNGEKETGVSTFKLQQEIDTGNILLSEKISIGDRETAGELHDRMKLTGAGLIVKTIEGLLNGSLQETPQPSGQLSLKTAPKIFTADCEINWHQPVINIYNQIRGLSPFPAAFTNFNGKTMKVFSAHTENGIPHSAPGSNDSDGKTYLRFAAADGYIYADEIQLEGKKKMNIADFLRGYRAPAS